MVLAPFQGPTTGRQPERHARGTRHGFQAVGYTCRESPEVDAAYRRNHVEGTFVTALSQAAEPIRSRA